MQCLEPDFKNKDYLAQSNKLSCHLLLAAAEILSFYVRHFFWPQDMTSISETLASTTAVWAAI